jgi:biotin carboxylase
MSNSGKILMVLGAGPFQVPGIRKAVALGHNVISVDDRPENVGHRFAHRRVHCSTTRSEELTRIAEELKIDGICTFSSDVAVPSVGYVCDRLGLPGISARVAQLMSTKHCFREAQNRASLPHPKFVAVRSTEDLEPVRRLSFPVIFKPVDSSGSRGVSRVNAPSHEAIADAFNFAKTFSPSGTVCAEEFVPGREFGGDAVVIDGKCAFLGVTEKCIEGFVVMGHSYPSSLGPEDRQRIKAALEASCHAVGYDCGPLNFDVKLDADQVTILEMSARTGGNGIPALLKRATGFDVEEATIRRALKEPLLGDWLEDIEATRGAASLVFGSPRKGVMKGMTSFANLRAKAPEVAELHVAAPIGAPVMPFQHNGNLIGCVVFDCASPAEYPGIAECIREALNVELDEATEDALGMPASAT